MKSAPQWDPSSLQIRQYEPADRADVLELDEAVWGRTMDESWFAWKYEENPYLDEPPVFVARADGRVVGARPFMVFRLRFGDRAVLALQPTDTMVHPDYRKQGIFTRMTEAAISHFADRDPELCFNFPNEMAWPGYRKLGWRVVSERTTYYRVQNPEAIGAEKFDGDLAELASAVAGPAARTILSIWTRRAPSPEGFSIERSEGAPAERLTELYRKRVPEEIHSYRDERFYRWRFASPAWRRHTYVAEADGTPTAGLIVRTRTTDGGVTIAQIADVAPLVGGPQWSAALARLLEEAIADHDYADVIAAHESPIPDDLLTAYGFLPNDRVPLSWGTEHRRRLVVRPLDDRGEAAWTVNGCRLADDDNWLLSFSERDTV